MYTCIYVYIYIYIYIQRERERERERYRYIHIVTDPHLARRPDDMRPSPSTKIIPKYQDLSTQHFREISQERENSTPSTKIIPLLRL